ncbi:MAG: hypothetical protein ABW036_12315 [Flavitalea sp.]
MKKILFALCFVLFCTTLVSAQDEMRPFKFAISTGYVLTTGDGAKGGFLISLEPKYAVIPALSVGVRAEIAAAVRGYGGNAYTGYDNAEVKASSSFIATADYYLTQNYSFRPFVGAGAGIYATASGETNDSEAAISSTAKNTFGGMGRVGFETLHFRLGIEYNLVPNTSYQDYNNPSTTVTTKNSYLGLKVGICIGGGRY